MGDTGIERTKENRVQGRSCRLQILGETAGKRLSLTETVRLEQRWKSQEWLVAVMLSHGRSAWAVVSQ